MAQRVKNPPASAGLILGSGRHLEGGWQPTPVSLPEKSHGRGCKESDMTEPLNRRKQTKHFIVPFICHGHLYNIYTCSLSHVQLFAAPWTEAHQSSLSMEFSRQEYWSGLPYSPPRDLPDPGIKHCASYIGRQVLHHCTTWEAHVYIFILILHTWRLRPRVYTSNKKQS